MFILFNEHKTLLFPAQKQFMKKVTKFLYICLSCLLEFESDIDYSDSGQKCPECPSKFIVPDPTRKQ